MVCTFSLEDRGGLCTIIVKGRGNTGKLGKSTRTNVPVEDSGPVLTEMISSLERELDSPDI